MGLDAQVAGDVGEVVVEHHQHVLHLTHEASEFGAELVRAQAEQWLSQPQVIETDVDDGATVRRHRAVAGKELQCRAAVACAGFGHRHRG